MLHQVLEFLSPPWRSRLDPKAASFMKLAIPIISEVNYWMGDLSFSLSLSGINLLFKELDSTFV